MIIRIAQIKVTPVKRQLRANHERLMATLDRVAEQRRDAVNTAEGPKA